MITTPTDFPEGHPLSLYPAPEVVETTYLTFGLCLLVVTFVLVASLSSPGLSQTQHIVNTVIAVYFTINGMLASFAASAMKPAHNVFMHILAFTSLRRPLELLAQRLARL